MPLNIFYIDKVNKSNIKIDIDLLRKQQDWFVQELTSAQVFLDCTNLVEDGVKATKKQIEMIQGIVNLMDALLDLGEGYA